MLKALIERAGHMLAHVAALGDTWGAARAKALRQAAGGRSITREAPKKAIFSPHAVRAILERGSYTRVNRNNILNGTNFATGHGTAWVGRTDSPTHPRRKRVFSLKRAGAQLVERKLTQNMYFPKKSGAVLACFYGISPAWMPS